MAKAKEWAERIETAPDLGAELQAFMAEIGEIAAARGNSPNAVEGAVREQKDKFKAVCARTTKVNPDLWPALMKAHGQEYMRDVKQFLQACQRSAGGPRRGKGRGPRRAA